jgi:hypothetical protein
VSWLSLEVKGITRVVSAQPYLDHWGLHMQARAWMMAQAYPMDFGPNHCACFVGEMDFEWRIDKYVPTLAKRYGVDVPQIAG